MCDGYLTPDGACLPVSHPIGITELPNTGGGEIVFLGLGLIVLVAGVLLLIGRSHAHR